jgi:hypothetical protein
MAKKPLLVGSLSSEVAYYRASCECGRRWIVLPEDRQDGDRCSCGSVPRYEAGATVLACPRCESVQSVLAIHASGRHRICAQCAVEGFAVYVTTAQVAH